VFDIGYDVGALGSGQSTDVHGARLIGDLTAGATDGTRSGTGHIDGG
jgi:hypothetical protein